MNVDYKVLGALVYGRVYTRKRAKTLVGNVIGYTIETSESKEISYVTDFELKEMVKDGKVQGVTILSKEKNGKVIESVYPENGKSLISEETVKPVLKLTGEGIVAFPLELNIPLERCSVRLQTIIKAEMLKTESASRNKYKAQKIKKDFENKDAGIQYLEKIQDNISTINIDTLVNPFETGSGETT